MIHVHTAVGPTVRKVLFRRGDLPDTITYDFDFVKAGLIDSLSLLRFVLELEEEFNIELTNEDIVRPEFKTFGGLCSIIERKLG